MRDSKNIKPIEEVRKHFIERLKERYGLEISESEYDQLINKKFQGLFGKSYNKSIGVLFIKDVKVYVLYESWHKRFLTVYPPGIETDINETIKCCFSTSIFTPSKIIYNLYLQESKIVKMDFETEKDAAVYFFKETLFPDIHIDVYKHGSFRTMKMAHIIKNILNERYPHCKLTVQKCRIGS